MHTREQIQAIRRYQSHLRRKGRVLSEEQAAREWIERYAALWRQHMTTSTESMNRNKGRRVEARSG